MKTTVNYPCTVLKAGAELTVLNVEAVRVESGMSESRPSTMRDRRCIESYVSSTRASYLRYKILFLVQGTLYSYINSPRYSALQLWFNLSKALSAGSSLWPYVLFAQKYDTLRNTGGTTIRKSVIQFAFDHINTKATQIEL